MSTSAWMRPPPPGDAPPAYARVTAKVYPYTLRPIVAITAVLGIVWGVAMGVACLRGRGSDTTSKEKLLDLISASLFFVVAAIEGFALLVSILQSLRFARLFFVLVPLGMAVALGAQIAQIIEHFVAKSALIQQCIADDANDQVYNGINSAPITLTPAELQAACERAWSHDGWSVFGWLVFIIIVSLFFANIALTYYRQLVDPSLVRSRQPQTNQAFQMQPQGYGGPPTLGQLQQGPGQNGQQGWMVPPYPGPPAAGGPGLEQPFEKSDYHPDAPWAQSGDHLGYAPPPGPPPQMGGSGSGGGARGGRAQAEVGDDEELDPEEAAWRNAQRGGVTAHLTGHAPAPRGRDEEPGYIVENNEEDEAWDRARREGVTAHLTGHDRAPARRAQGEI